MPEPVATMSRSADDAPSVRFWIEIESLAGAGLRPEMGTPSWADCHMVCGESTPSRFGCETFGVIGIGERPGGGV